MSDFGSASKGALFAEFMYHALTFGVNHYAEDSTSRKQFAEENQHMFAGAMLVAVFSYLESTLGHNWIDRCGGTKANELKLLKLVRDAFVHKNSHIRDLGVYTQQQEADLASFISDMKAGKVKDEKDNTYVCFMELSQQGVVTMNSEAINIIRAYCRALAH